MIFRKEQGLLAIIVEGISAVRTGSFTRLTLEPSLSPLFRARAGMHQQKQLFVPRHFLHDPVYGCPESVFAPNGWIVSWDISNDERYSPRSTAQLKRRVQ